MAESGFQLRTYAFIDSMQPQYSAFLGSELDGDVVLSGMAELWLELAPGSEVYNLLDAALKSTAARPGLQMVEREFGVIELHSESVDAVKDAGRSILQSCGLSEEQRLKAQVVSAKVILSGSESDIRIAQEAAAAALERRCHERPFLVLHASVDRCGPTGSRCESRDLPPRRP